ncbi:MAG: hypothetical protein HYR74_06420 [Candidatus Eisenbacteria bacterium]|nr:hypothetical protein [Candidatus Eisenbacteria bacterium]
MDALLATVMAWVRDATWAGLAGCVLQLTLVATAGLAIARLARGGSAAFRHLALIVTMAALIALPLAGAALPAWRLPILPASSAPLSTGEPASLWNPALDLAPASAGDPSAARALRADRMADADARAATFVTSSLRGTSPVGAVRWPAALALLAIVVAAGLVARSLAGAMVVARVAARAHDVEDPAILAAFAAACARLGVAPRMRLVMSDRVGVPAVAGLLRPTLVLPPDAASWDADKLRIVFLHELAHVLRGDAVGLLLGRVATALYWFHPLAWTLARETRRESERACDDVVLGCGERASAYAGHLLAIASAAGARDPLAGLTLAAARRSSLEGRLVAILRDDLARAPVSRRATWIAVIAAAAALSAFASVRVVAAPAKAARVETRTRTAYAMSERTVTSEATVASEPPPPPDAGEAAEPDGGAIAAGDKTDRSRIEREQRAREERSREDEWARDRSGASWFEEGKRLYDDERYGEAGDAYVRAGESGYREGTSFYDAACSFSLAGSKARAIETLQRAIEAGFDDPTQIANDSDLDPLREDPRFAEVVRRTSPEATASRKRSRLLEEFERMRRTEDAQASDWGTVGIQLMRSGACAEAADAFQHQHELEPASVNPIYNTACAYALGGDKARALEALERAIAAGYGDADHIAKDEDLRPLHGDARFDRAVRLTEDLALYDQGRDDEDVNGWRADLPRFQRVTREHADMGRAWFNLGYAALRAGDARHGYDAFHRALDLHYREGTTMYDLGCAAARLSETDRAIEWLEKAEAAGMSLAYMAPHDRDLESVRYDPRFRELMDRAERDEWHKAYNNFRDKVGIKRKETDKEKDKATESEKRKAKEKAKEGSSDSD